MPQACLESWPLVWDPQLGGMLQAGKQPLMYRQTQNFHILMSKSAKSWCQWLDPVNFIPVSKRNLHQMRKLCSISKDRQALSSPNSHQKKSWFTRNNTSRGEQDSVLNHMPSPSTSIWHHTKRIQHSKHSLVCLCFVEFFSFQFLNF